MENKVFESFTWLYEISKTLRFELKPVWETFYNLENDWVIEKDREIEKNYHQIKELLDDLHILFVEKSLENINLSKIDEFYSAYLNYKNSKKDKKISKEFENKTKELRKELTSFFESEWNLWKDKYSFLKKWWIWFLTEKEVLDLLIFLNPEKEEIIKKFDRFFTYFTNFNESRKNFYSDNWIAWAIATRAIDENFTTFIDNKIKFDDFSKNNLDWCQNNFTEEEKNIFNLDFYNNCLLQKDIDFYNKIIWWYSEENWNKIPWINERINLYKQSLNHNNSKDKKFPKFELLYKQILSKTDKQNFINEIEDDNELIKIIESVINKSKEKVFNLEDLLLDFFNNNNNYNIENIYISKVSINTISNKFFENWDTLKIYLWNNKKDFYNFLEIKNALENIEDNNIFKEFYYSNNTIDKNQNNYLNFLKVFEFEIVSTINNYNEFFKNIKNIELDKFEKNEENIQIIKNFFDSIQSFYSIVKYFNVEKNKKSLEEYSKDIKFYNIFDNLFIDFDIWKKYNLVRNYVTKKQVKTDKFKLNFDNSQFLTWWDRDKEKERLWVIIKDENKYYLAVLKNNKVFENYKYDSWDFYEKMNYKQLNNVYRQLPRLLFPLQKKLDSLKWVELEKYLSKYYEYWYCEEIREIKKEFDIFQKNKNKWELFEQKKLNKLIKYYQNWVYKLYSDKFDLEEINSRKYTDLSTLYKEIEEKMYKLEFLKISKDFINQKTKSWEIYLFQIYNKDFAEWKKTWSKENIHTKYFKLLFDEKNLENLVYKLSGWAEIFFRDKTKTKDLKTKFDNYWNEIIDHKRYSNDKIMFHISITLNANKWDKYKFNDFVNKYLNKNQDINIIWIDRWEKHLAYYSVINKSGEILETNTLNIVNWINYLEKLEKIEDSRKQARVSWGNIENIKELKNWYISQVVNKLCELVLKYNAIIVFEDLNWWFKRWRQKIEKQVYQKLELALAKKLNYLTLKNIENNKLGWYFKAYQLVPKVNDYQDIANYKQSWIIFYTRANYTSTTCPCCWFRKNKYISNSSTLQKLKKEFEDIKIIFDWENFIFQYKIIQNKKSKEKLNKTNFKLNSKFSRFKYNSKKMLVEEIDINEKLKDLFYEIDINNNINNQILDKDLKFYKSLVYYFNLVLQLRNSDSKNNIDYLICPSCNFHSIDWFQDFEYNADANWAYNIARKWIITLDRINKKLEKPDLYISDFEWNNFTQSSIT